MCREKETLLHLHFVWNYAPLKFFLLNFCLLYNFNTLKNIFIKLGTNIKYHQMMWGEKES